MKLARFNDLRDRLNQQCEVLLGTKAADYAREGDRLDNFKRVADTLGLTPLEVWAVYFQKHIIAIQKFVREDGLADESLESRFVDARNYIDLGWALVNEGEGD